MRGHVIFQALLVFKKNFFKKVHLYMCFCLWACACECGVHGSRKWGGPGAGVVADCAPPSVGAGSHTWDLCKNSTCSRPLCHLSGPLASHGHRLQERLALSFLLSLSCIHVIIHVRVCVHMCVPTCGSQRRTSGVVPGHLLLCFFETASLTVWSSPGKLNWLASTPQGSAYLCPLAQH